jgi:hypothetical protein
MAKLRYPAFFLQAGLQLSPFHGQTNVYIYNYTVYIYNYTVYIYIYIYIVYIYCIIIYMHVYMCIYIYSESTNHPAPNFTQRFLLLLTVQTRYISR